jgi:translation initiation factor 1
MGLDGFGGAQGAQRPDFPILRRDPSPTVRIGSNTAMKPVNPNGGLVYSTEAGRMCPACRSPVAQCRCKKAGAAAAASSDGVVRLFFETKGRGGKGVTVVRGLGLDDAALIVLGKTLKTACGVGGTTKDGVIELQGDHRDRVMTLLEAQGRNVKKAGG